MDQQTKPMIPVSIPGAIIMPYRYYAGSIGSKFFVELRDNKKLMGIKCPQCNLIYSLPRSTCIRCFGKLNDWVELDGTGTLESYTIVHYSLPVHPFNPPFIFGIIKLDGADTGLTHFVGEVDLDEPEIGMKVKPEFREKREGNILDIKYFKPINR